MEFSTTFKSDFAIADRFGTDAVKDTYDRAFKEWKSDIRYMTDMCMVLNHALRDHYQNNQIDLAHVYNDLYYDCYDYICENFKGKDLEYFYKITD